MIRVTEGLPTEVLGVEASAAAGATSVVVTGLSVGSSRVEDRRT